MCKKKIITLLSVSTLILSPMMTMAEGLSLDTEKLPDSINEESGKEIKNDFLIPTYQSDEVVAIEKQDNDKKVDNDKLVKIEEQEISEIKAPTDSFQRADDDLDSGVSGTSPWRLDKEGTLHIGAGEWNSAEGRINNWMDGNHLDHRVKKIVFEGKVIAYGSLDFVFAFLAEVDEIENFTYLDTTNVTSMERLFEGSTKIKALDLSNFNVSNVTNMICIFEGLREIEYLDVSHFDTSKVKDMELMFNQMSSLKEIDVSHFDTSNVRNMRFMFGEMTSLEELDISSFDMRKVRDSDAIFYETPNLQKLTVGDNFGLKYDFFKSGLQNPDNDSDYSGKWVLSESDQLYTVDELNDEWETNPKPGTYVWAVYPKIDVKDSVIYVGDTYIGQENLVQATNNSGQLLELSDLEVDYSQVNTQETGEYDVTYTYQSTVSTAKVTVEPRQTAIQVHDSVVYTGDKWEAEANFDSAVDKRGDAVSFDDIQADTSQVDLTKPGKYEVKYSYDGVESKAVITVKENKSVIKVRDSSLYVGDTWSPKDNFDSALDKDGNLISFEFLTVDDSKVDIQNPGTYDVMYSYEGKTSTAKITVKANKIAVNVHDSTIYTGDKWEAKDNFDSALDKDGKELKLSDLEVNSSKVDTEKSGVYEVTYSYEGKISTAKVTVKENKSEIKVHDSMIYTGDKWEAKNNFDSATDKDGKELKLSDLEVDSSKVDMEKPGIYDVTYSYEGKTSTAKVTVKENKSEIKVHDSTIYVGETWSPTDNFNNALDKDGQPVAFEKLTVDDSQVDSQTPGTYDVTYSYEGKTSIAKIIVKANQTAVKVHDSMIYTGDKWEAKDNFDSALDKDGKAVKFEKVTVDDSQLKLDQPGTYDVMYSYDGVVSIAKITVKENKSEIKVHDSMIYTGDKWEAKNNFDSAKDKDGKELKLSDLEVDTSKMDTKKPGIYDVTYSYEGKTSTAKVTVKENKSVIKVHDSSLYVGETWNPKDNFENALDKDGQPVAFDDLVVDASKVDIQNPGSYNVTYSYEGKTSTAKITVKANQTAVKVHDSTFYIGDKWEEKDNFDSAVDKDGKAVKFEKVTVDDSQLKLDQVGTYDVTYSYDGVVSTAKITVKENLSKINVHDSIIYTGDKWEAKNNFDSAKDKDGKELKLSDLEVDTSKMDTKKPGIYDVTYSYEGKTSTAKVTVKENKSEIKVHDSSLYVGETWSPTDNFDSALDKDGNIISFESLTVDDSKVDIQNPGDYNVTYSYEGKTSTAKITVKANQTAVKVHDSTFYIGDKWEEKDNFDSAVDKDGKAVKFEKVTVDDSQLKLDQVGTYDVVYSYDGVVSIAKITVKENKSEIKVHDSTTYPGDKWEAKNNFDSATNKDGKELKLSDLEVDSSKVDTEKPGVYDVTYSYEGKTSTAKVTVKENKSVIKVHDSSLYVGETWSPTDNFESALDKAGQPVAFDDLVVDASKVDIQKPGTYNVTYSYESKTSTAKITVKANQTAVNVHDSTVYIGDKWEAKDNFDGALDKDGKPVKFEKVTVDDSQLKLNQVGTYEVIYSYDGVENKAKVTVKEKKTALNIHESVIYEGDEWKPEDNFDSALDKDGNQVSFDKVQVDSSQVNLELPGTYDVIYSYEGITQIIQITIKEKLTALNVHDSTIYEGDTWNPKDNFDSALNKKGESISYEELEIDSQQMDNQKEGIYQIIYRYEGLEEKATVTVKKRNTAINVHDSVIYVGDKWKAEDNFDSALDKDRNEVLIDDIQVNDSQVDITKPGKYKVTYQYDQLESIAFVTVKEKATAVNVHDSTVYVGDKWEATDNFDNGLTYDGKRIAFDEITVDDSRMNIAKPGVYEIYYHFNEVTSVAHITVKEKATAVNVHDSAIYVGDDWKAEDNFDSALDKEGNTVPFKELKVDSTGMSNKQPGTYEVSYQYEGVTSVAKVTVKTKIINKNKDNPRGPINNKYKNGKNSAAVDLPTTGEKISVVPFLSGIMILITLLKVYVKRLKRIRN